jgi:hypothetical protein
MISAKKIRANRANARASTGPKTAQGKARAAKNAHRHGLSLSVLTDPARSAEFEKLALKIAGDGASPEVFACAFRISEAQIDVLRARQARLDLLHRHLDDDRYDDDDGASWEIELDSKIDEKADVVLAILRGLGPNIRVSADHMLDAIANPHKRVETPASRPPQGLKKAGAHVSRFRYAAHRDRPL